MNMYNVFKKRSQCFEIYIEFYYDDDTVQRGFFNDWNGYTFWTTMSEQFNNPIEKSQIEAKLISLTHKYMTIRLTDLVLKVN